MRLERTDLGGPVGRADEGDVAYPYGRKVSRGRAVFLLLFLDLYARQQHPRLTIPLGHPRPVLSSLPIPGIQSWPSASVFLLLQLLQPLLVASFAPLLLIVLLDLLLLGGGQFWVGGCIFIVHCWTYAKPPTFYIGNDLGIGGRCCFCDYLFLQSPLDPASQGCLFFVVGGVEAYDHNNSQIIALHNLFGFLCPSERCLW